MGVWPALLLSGLIHGLWHSPQLYIHVTHGTFDAFQVVMFVVFAVVVGVIFGRLRLASGSVWPAVTAHGADDVLLMVGFLTFSHTDTPTNPLRVRPFDALAAPVGEGTRVMWPGG